MYIADKKRYDTMVYNRCGKSGLKLPVVSMLSVKYAKSTISGVFVACVFPIHQILCFFSTSQNIFTGHL